MHSHFYLFKLSVICSILFTLSLSLFAQESPTKPGDDIPSIIGGEAAQIEDYPWHVALVSTNEENLFDAQFCAGTIIDPFWILTASHCLDGETRRSIEVAAGVTTLSEGGGQRVGVAQIIMHPDFGAGETGLGNDIALLRLITPLDLSRPGVEAIPFATQVEAANGGIDPGVIAIITGWGVTELGTFSDELRVVEVPIVSNAMANTNYNGRVSDDMLAAGNFNQGGADACGGDSGGPLVVADATGEGWLLAGITSWGEGCGVIGFPGIYARVSFFDSWIIEHTGIGTNPNPPVQLDAAWLWTNVTTLNGQLAQCGDETSLNFQGAIVNEGLDSLRSVQVVLQIGSDLNNLTEVVTDTLTFDPPLGTGSSYLLGEREVMLSDTGDFFLRLSLNNPNESEDLQPENNIRDLELSIEAGYTVSFTFLTDDFPEENLWAIFLQGEDEPFYIGNGGTPYPEANTEYTESVCLPPGDYQFLIIDDIGDGLTAGADFDFSVSSGGEDYILIEYTDEFSDEFSVNFSLPFVPDLDAAAALANLTDGISFATCENSFSLLLQLKNEGSLLITSALLEVNLNGQIDTLETDQSLAAGNVAEIKMDEVSFNEGQNQLAVRILEINEGQMDSNPSNDTVSASFSFALTDLPLDAGLLIRLDDFPEESSWDIINEHGVVFASGGNYFELNQEVQEVLCFAEGCYQFRLFDSFADGIFQDGNVVTYQLADGTELFSLTGEFGASNTADFCMLAPPADLVAVTVEASRILLSWTDQSEIESGFQVERADSGTTDFVAIAEVGANTTQYEDTNGESGQTYTYRVRTLKESDVSIPSDTASATLITRLAQRFDRDLHLYPNPAHDYLSLSFSGELALGRRYELHLLDLQGHSLMQKTISAQTRTVIDLPALPAAVYIVRIQTHLGSVFRKLMVRE